MDLIVIQLSFFAKRGRRKAPPDSICKYTRAAPKKQAKIRQETCGHCGLGRRFFRIGTAMRRIHPNLADLHLGEKSRKNKRICETPKMLLKSKIPAQRPLFRALCGDCSGANALTAFFEEIQSYQRFAGRHAAIFTPKN